MLRTKAIKAPIVRETDGLRISVMRRHTLNDGVTPDSEITKDLWDQWRIRLAPEPELLGDYYKRGLPWEEFEKRYLNFLEEKRVQDLLDLIIDARKIDVTLLCVEKDPKHCHRRLLAEVCQELDPELEVEIY